ncbi:retinol dehydrogenase [Bimuria novae-zelandiae CBS 107.79]|uniref:Retinol dehydrogenase n=1 Tax=Bimuria novae-zelandiae CBS 107.79 TaxID=1447943 RepID=A0A6A5USC0_9PLEO|nr:retinol dehydrogenase [Bimuria novae-zelandiae CBS 107.79]
MSRYDEAHANPQGPGDARPTALQIIKDEGAEGTLKGQVIVITGVSAGIGIETARALATTGAKLFLTIRNLEKAQNALKGVFDPSTMELVKMDNASLASVREAANAILAKTSKIHLLVENSRTLFGTNHLSHFLFFKLLEPTLLAAATPELPSRVVVLSSSAHNVHGLNVSDNYDFQKGGYEPNVAYGQSKTANIYMANEIERRYGSKNLHATSLHPGIINTELIRHLPKEALEGFKAVYPLMKSIEQGAATTVWAAVGKQWKDKGGKYLANCQEIGLIKSDEEKFISNGYAPHAYDVEEAKRLWRDSLKMVGLPAED